MANIIKDALDAGNACQAGLVASAAALEALAARHRRLLEQAAQMPAGEAAGTSCRCSDELRRTLLECIQVLEETRRSFKSRRLAELRQRLIVKLSELDRTG